MDPVNTTALVNSTVVLACEPPVGEPDPVIQWKKDNQLLDPSLDPRLVVLPTGDLYISDVLSTDSGQYQCIARNPITESRRRSQHATLTVIRKQIYFLECLVIDTVIITPPFCRPPSQPHCPPKCLCPPLRCTCDSGG